MMNSYSRLPKELATALTILNDWINLCNDENPSREIPEVKALEIVEREIFARLPAPALGGGEAKAVAEGVYTDQPIWDAIAAATHIDKQPDGFARIVVSAEKFIEAFNGHRDRKLCTSLNLPAAPARTVEDVARALDESQSLLVQILHIGPRRDFWQNEGLERTINAQIISNRAILSGPAPGGEKEEQ